MKKIIIITLFILLCIISIFGCTNNSNSHNADTSNTSLEDNKEFVTISFEINETTKMEAIKVEKNKNVILPSGPELANLLFDSWQLDGESINRYEFSTDGDVTLKAFYIPNYNISIDSNNGNEIRVLNFINDPQITSIEPPFREGYLFDGWEIDGEKVDISKNPIEKSTTIKALWIKGDLNKTQLRNRMTEIIKEKGYSDEIEKRLNFIFDRLYELYPVYSSFYTDLPSADKFVEENFIYILKYLNSIYLYLKGTKEADEMYQNNMAGLASTDEKGKYIKAVISDEKSLILRLKRTITPYFTKFLIIDN